MQQMSQCQCKQKSLSLMLMVKYVSYAKILILGISKIELLTPNRLKLRDQHWIIDDSVCKKVKYAVSLWDLLLSV